MYEITEKCIREAVECIFGEGYAGQSNTDRNKISENRKKSSEEKLENSKEAIQTAKETV